MFSMRQFFFILFIFGTTLISVAQTTLITPGNLGNNIQTTSTKGGIQFPAMPFDSIKAITNPKQGTVVFDTDCQCLRLFSGKNWSPFSSSENTFQAIGNFKVWQTATKTANTPAFAKVVFQTTGITHDDLGNIYACGQMLGPMSYNNISYPYPPNASAEIGFILKYNRQGALIWLKQLNTEMGFVRPKQIKFDSNTQGIYVAGEYVQSAQIQLSNGNITVNTPSGIHFGAFTAKFSASTGQGIWLRGEYGTGSLGSNVMAHSLAIGSVGDVYTIGYIRGSLNSPPNGNTVVSSGDNTTSDCFIIKYDTNGNRIWAKDLGGNGVNEVGYGISFSNEKLYITGSYRNNTTFDGITLSNTGNSENGFLARLNGTNGTYEWAVGISGTGEDIGYDVVMTKNAQLYVVGTCTSTQTNPVVLGSTNGSTSTSLYTITNTTDYFLAKYTEAGVAVKATKIGSLDTEDGWPKIVADTSGNVYLAASPRGPVQLDGLFAQSLSDRNGIFIKYDVNLRLQWYFMANGHGNDEARALTVTPEGWLYATGVFDDMLFISPYSFNTSQGMIYFVQYRE